MINLECINAKQEPKYTVSDMTDEEAQEVCAWRYPGVYSVYDFPDWEVCKSRGWVLSDAEKRKDAYYTLRYADAFLGFFHVMERTDHLELGVGLRPEACGMHHGPQLMKQALELIKRRYGHTMVQLQVRTFNDRAIRCYEKAGFTIVATCEEETEIAGGQMHIMQLQL